jgi:hypothetical protein
MRTLALLCCLPFAASACPCQTSFSDLAFIGTVESITPIFLNRWSTTNRTVLQSLNDAYFKAQEHPSDTALAHLKEVYAKNFPDALADVQAAKSVNELTALFYSTLNRGMRIHFKVGTLFKNEADDDDAKPGKDDDDDEFDIWTPFGDCGLDFQAGETYLVYANNDESSGLYSATRCTRTRRLTDAGEDLAFLYFRKEHEETSSRLEGFATQDPQFQLELTKMRDPQSVKLPVPGVIVELESEKLTRYIETDSKGRYIFDGLAEGDYKVSAYAPGYPAKPKLLAEPRPVHLEAAGCGLQILLLPKN